MNKISFLPFTVLLVAILLASCSSAPKRPAEVFAIQSMVETTLGRANAEADQGNYLEALKFLDEAWQMAVKTDRPHLRIRVSIARANVLYAQGRIDQAGRIWDAAEQEAIESKEDELASACRIYRARSRLLAGEISARETLALTLREKETLKKDKLLIALNWTLKGLAEKDLGRYDDAENSIMNAVTIHEKTRYLEQAAYDWYLIASIRSVAGKYRQAIAALNNALSFDRRAENSYGLAMTWSAMGDVYQKMENAESAIAAWQRAAEIFRAMERYAQAREMETNIRQMRRQEGIQRPRRFDETDTPRERPDNEDRIIDESEEEPRARRGLFRNREEETAEGSE